MRKVIFVVLLLLLPGIVAAQQRIINNDSVIRLSQSGLSEDAIITAINTSPGAYDTSVDGLIALQNAGVGEKVIEAILAKSAAPAPKTGTFSPYEPPATLPDRDQPATRPPAREAWDSENDEVEQKFRVGMKILAGKNSRVSYGFSVGIPINNKIGIESGLLTYGDSYNYYEMGVSARAYVIPASLLFTVANIDAEELYIRPYVGVGANIAIAKATAYWWDYSASASNYKFGGQLIFGAEFTFKAVPQLSFGPEFGYYRILEGQGMLAGVTVNFNIK